MDAKTLCGPKGKQDNFMIQTFLKPSAETIWIMGCGKEKQALGKF